MMRLPPAGSPSSRAARALSFALALLAFAPPASAQLMQADFTGRTGTLWGPNFNACCNTAFGGLTWRGPNISGTFTYDASLIPSSGVVNVPLPTGGDDPFRLVMGDGSDPFVFTAAMALPTTVAQVQYNNGGFNGFAYFSAFFYNGHEYQLDIQGGTWTIYDRANGVRNLSRKAAAGSINIGNANLIDVRPVEPLTTVPEPSTIVLLATGLAGIVGAARRGRATRA